jgi:hypothetical protein
MSNERRKLIYDLRRRGMEPVRPEAEDILKRMRNGLCRIPRSKHEKDWGDVLVHMGYAVPCESVNGVGIRITLIGGRYCRALDRASKSLISSS